MTIYITEAEVEQLAPMPLVLEAIEEAFLLQGTGQVENTPRSRSRLERGILHVMSASLPSLGVGGLKTYTSVAGTTRFHVLLYSGADGSLLAILEADKLGQLRTGAASGVATRWMARNEATRLGILGTGWQAQSQLEAVCAVRSIQTVVAYGRNPERRIEFCRKMTEKLGIGVYPASTPEEAARDMDIVITATTAREPVLKGEWLAAGTHVNAIGSNFISKQEIDANTVGRSGCVIVDSLEQARKEAGDLVSAFQAGCFFWEDARELGQVVAGQFPGREGDQEITLFKSLGIALEDIALAQRIFRAALEAGYGRPLPI